MKPLIISFIIVLSIPLLIQAQYSGGNGRGDVSLECLNILTNSGNNINKIPASTSLEQNYPNPFNPATNIKFYIAESGNVKLVVYDVMGREVQTLVNKALKPGQFVASFDGSLLTSGVYFYKISAGDYSETRRMMLQK